jgi:UDP-N-acetylmuramoylalanine--D-glutamate ligase
MPISEIELRGEHNLQNVLAASALSLAAGLPDASIREGVAGFSGVAHRLEYVRTWGGAEWYNDSIATAPERTLAAMRSFTEPLILLAGGKDKDLPWDEFAAYALDHLKHLIVFGSAADLIKSAIEAARTAAGSSGNALTLTHCSGLQEAVIAAARIVQPGDIVLLSPGGTSFDEFKDFEERGLCFRQLVMQL